MDRQRLVTSYRPSSTGAPERNAGEHRFHCVSRRLKNRLVERQCSVPATTPVGGRGLVRVISSLNEPRRGNPPRSSRRPRVSASSSCRRAQDLERAELPDVGGVHRSGFAVGGSLAPGPSHRWATPPCSSRRGSRGGDLARAFAARARYDRARPFLYGIATNLVRRGTR